jgi:AhpD family alkylhydroperoxidase
MQDFKLHTLETAPEESKALLQKSIDAYGMIPSLHAVMAESPKILEAYQLLTNLFMQSSLTKEEQHVVWLTVNVNNQCHYCVPAHSQIAIMDGIDKAIVKSIRACEPLSDPRLEALRSYTQALVLSRGIISEAETNNMLEQGFNNKNLLDINLGIGHKVLSNYTNYLAKTPIDEPYLPFKEI